MFPSQRGLRALAGEHGHPGQEHKVNKSLHLVISQYAHSALLIRSSENINYSMLGAIIRENKTG
jgi:hypothetical protein